MSDENTDITDEISLLVAKLNLTDAAKAEEVERILREDLAKEYAESERVRKQAEDWRKQTEGLAVELVRLREDRDKLRDALLDSNADRERLREELLRREPLRLEYLERAEKAEAENKRLREERDKLRERLAMSGDYMNGYADGSMAAEQLREALEGIREWARDYPLTDNSDWSEYIKAQHHVEALTNAALNPEGEK